MWIASTATAQLLEVGADGTLVSSVPLEGRQPSDVVQAADSTLWFIDAERLELVQVAPDGALLTALPLVPFTSLESPHLALDGNALWITHPEESALLLVDVTTGSFIDERIDLTRPDGTRLGKAVGIAISPEGQLWVTDSLGAAVVLVNP